MAGTSKVHKIGIDLGGNDLIRPKLTSTTMASAGEIGYNGTYLKFYSGGNERSIGGTGTDALRLDEFKDPITSVSLGNQKIINLLDPTSPQDAATKYYVDSVVSGLDNKGSVRAGTVSNIVAARSGNVLTATANGAISGDSAVFDGVTLVLNNRVLVKNQTTGADNGLYYVSDVGSAGTPYVLTRTTDADNTPSGEVTAGLYAFIEEGATQQDTGWVLITDDPIVLNTTSLSFTQFSSAGIILGGAGLVKTGNVLDVVSANSAIVVNTNDITLTLGTNSGLAISSGLVVNSTIAGGGLTFTAGVLDIVSGNSAIAVNANDVTFTLATNSGLVISSGLAIDSSVAGNGLTFTTGVLNVVSGNSAIVTNANDITLTLATNSGLTISGGLGLNSTIAGQGLAYSSGIIDVASANSAIVVNANDIALTLASGSGLSISSGLKIDTTVVARKFVDITTVAGDDSTTDFVITHNLANQWVSVTVINKTTLEEEITDIERTSTSVVTVKFAIAPISGGTEDYAVIVVG